MENQDNQRVSVLSCALANRDITLRGQVLSPEQRAVVLPVVESWVHSDGAFSAVEDECIRALADAGLPLPGDAAAMLASSRPRMKTVYVAGPYRAPTREQVSENIEHAGDIGLRVASLGYSPVIPHMNTAHMDAQAPYLDDYFWLDATLELMRRCDAVVLVPGWENSVGTQGEILEARRLGIPVFEDANDLPAPWQLAGRCSDA